MHSRKDDPEVEFKARHGVGRRPLKWKWQEALGYVLKIYPCISGSMYIRHFCFEKYMDQDTIHGLVDSIYHKCVALMFQ